MNDKPSSSHSVSQTEIDALVEGLLAPQEVHALVDRLDCAPDLWRRCALGFIEAQSLKRTLQSVVPPAKPAPPQPNPAVSKESRWRSGWTTRVATALAACLLVATGVVIGGIAVGTGWLDPTGGPLARTPVRSQTDRQTDPRNVDPASDPTFQREVAHALANLAVADGQIIALVDCSMGNHKQLVPIVRSKTLQKMWFEERPPALPGELQRQLRSAGWNVHQQRQLLSVWSGTGNQNRVVPVDLLDYRFQGVPIY